MAQGIPPRSSDRLGAFTAMGPGWMPTQGTKILQAPPPKKETALK